MRTFIPNLIALLATVTVSFSAVVGCQSTSNTDPKLNADKINEEQASSASASEEASENRLKLKNLNCTGIVIPKDIWALEPLLVEQGLLTADMPKAEKQKIIEDYIKQRKSSFPKCGETK